MIGLILELLSVSEFYAESELIEIAKGKNKLENTIKGKTEQKNRAWQYKRR